MNSVAPWHIKHHEELLHGRYISPKKIEPLLHNLKKPFLLNTVGYSVENRPIHSVKIGKGDLKILMWSQMHGNESTTTKAIFDLFKALADPKAPEIFKQIVENCSLCIIPQLNPDGASAYTRNNAADIDLNRDAQLLSQPESRVLREVFDDFQPDVCFNLHGQRTIYGMSATATPSIMSFLAPAGDSERSITLSRKRAMSAITHINKELSSELYQHIGRYDDGFNINCTGDTFTSEGVPTILFEAGHYPQDYEREKVRQLVFQAMITAISGLMGGIDYEPEDYFSIPEHEKCYCDVLIRNGAEGDIVIQFEEVLNNETIDFIPKVERIGSNEVVFGHRLIDAKGQKVSHCDGSTLSIGDVLMELKINDDITITLS